MVLWQTKYVIVPSVLLAALAVGWIISTKTTQQGQVDLPESSRISGSGLLDGMTFSGEIGLIGEAADVKDSLVFDRGKFTSTECDRRCGYPPAPYFVRRVGDKIEFVSESRCLYKDATLAWRGTVDDGAVEGRLRWTVNRWYWTIKKEFWFKGKLAEPGPPEVRHQ